ncbi:MAG: LysM peptidoglycan-binding domain-containing M23 family metallopeptidase [Sandaracinaceae bacterium]|nr:LysM peptidoglycan-binding domain-containing M23 family metallopeptidase [Sandaracinaceae bacterium]
MLPDGGVMLAGYHTLSEGETLWDLANAYDKTVDELLEANGFTDDDVRGMRPGGRILIPGVAPSAIRSAVRPEGRGIWHTVAEGESIWDIARRYRLGASEIMGANALSRDEVSDLRTGRRLFIPGRGPAPGSREPARERPLTGAQRGALARAQLLGLGTSQAGHKLLGGVVEPRWLRAVGGNADRFAGTLRWPVTNGRFVRGYGSGEQGYHLAVDIAGDIGWNVRAAAPGLVGYSGDGIRGYGNIVLVIHQGGWVTLYAHNSVNFVVAGERVRAGGVLAEVGSTGISRGPHVHFEFMYAGQNCDPAELFRPGLRYSGSRSRRSATGPAWALDAGQGPHGRAVTEPGFASRLAAKRACGPDPSRWGGGGGTCRVGAWTLDQGRDRALSQGTPRWEPRCPPRGPARSRRGGQRPQPRRARCRSARRASATGCRARRRSSRSAPADRSRGAAWCPGGPPRGARAGRPAHGCA